MNPLDRILAQAKGNVRRIAMSEGEDPRIVEGSLRAQRDGLARITLIGNEAAVVRQVQEKGGQPSDVGIVDPSTSPDIARYAAAFYELRKHKGVDQDAARAAILNPLNFAAMMVRLGDADGTIGGAVATTADTVRAALQIIGRQEGASIVSSFFVMILDQPHHVKQGSFVFADCALVVDPTPEELADIAIASADSFRALVGEEPRVAMLSFSTSGSAKHDRVTKVAEATARVRSLRPDLAIGGDLQFDAAFVPKIGTAKAPTSPVKGDANVFVFPSLEAANIGYKIAERIGGARAVGPVLQGLAKPANDLSRGCSVDDVYQLIGLTAAQASSAR
ncbi:MAG: phosphate acetyltransferase [Alphaproteobacteria bacterium]|nr:phosphate acetyltransferase [Alphaproteobacteria bacterium]